METPSVNPEETKPVESEASTHEFPEHEITTFASDLVALMDKHGVQGFGAFVKLDAMDSATLERLAYHGSVVISKLDAMPKPELNGVWVGMANAFQRLTQQNGYFVTNRILSFVQKDMAEGIEIEMKDKPADEPAAEPTEEKAAE